MWGGLVLNGDIQETGGGGGGGGDDDDDDDGRATEIISHITSHKPIDIKLYNICIPQVMWNVTAGGRRRRFYL